MLVVIEEEGDGGSREAAEGSGEGAKDPVQEGDEGGRICLQEGMVQGPQAQGMIDSSSGFVRLRFS